jgi:hypothetical protein
MRDSFADGQHYLTRLLAQLGICGSNRSAPGVAGDDFWQAGLPGRSRWQTKVWNQQKYQL